MTFWVAGAAVVGSVANGAMQSHAAGKAADAQQAAADASNNLSRQQYDQTVARNAPFVSGGTTSFNALLDRLGLSGNAGAQGFGTLGQNNQFSYQPGGNYGDLTAGFKAPTAEQVMAEPGYEFARQQGEQAIQRQLNAKGMRYSGAEGKALARFGNDYASGQYANAFGRLGQANAQDFGQRSTAFGQNMAAQGQGYGQALNAFNANQGAQQQQYNQLSGVANTGQQAANNTSAYGSQYASTAGQNLQGAANAQGAAAIGQANAWGNALNQGISAFKNSGLGGSGGGGLSAYDSAGIGIDPNGFLGGASTAGDYSDARLKTNIRRIGATRRGNAWYSWDWKTGGSGEGVIAQEVAHIPGAVSKDADGLLMVDYTKV